MYRSLKLYVFLFVLAAITISFIGINREKRPDLTVMGFVNMSDGLGKQGAELTEAFRRDLDVDFKHTLKIKNKKIPKRIKKITQKNRTKWGKVLLFEDILWGPSEGSRVNFRDCPKDTIKIAYSMYEATKIPQEWVDILNGKFDAVIVPSEFLIEVYQNSGVQIPVFKIPLGINLKQFLREPLKEKQEHKFIFGNLSAGSDRKNHVTLIKAFAKAFGNDPSVQLFINVRYCDKKIRKEISKVINLLDLDNIRFAQKSLSKRDYLQKLKEFDCYVSASKGEGFSIQPREAMALGIPVIAAENTGQIEICNSGLVEVVQSPIRKLAYDPWGAYCGYNFDCHIDELAAAMKRVKDHYQDYLAKSKDARIWASKYQYSELKPLYMSAISPKKVIFGEENKITPEYLVTNSKNLFKKYENLFGKNITESSNESIFTNIYKICEWGRNEAGEGYSGLGSTLENAAPYISCLQQFIKDNNIKSIVDLGCGDWTFSKYLDWGGIQYTGIDVVGFVIEQNQKLYSAPNIHFVHADAAEFDLPEADLLICKDVLQHLSNKDIEKTTKQFHKYKHCLITNDLTMTSKKGMNEETEYGEVRPLDLTKAPFKLKGERILQYKAHGNTKVMLHITGN